ncbi:hypothetical protein YPPY52_2976, partial [Yersinia pestis PY-52]
MARLAKPKKRHPRGDLAFFDIKK